ncbi:MAG TPA: GH3 auxin-responsive promoter family protein [Alphaproteobacteria bacterium]|nr:GH3 auxin-responsive promoter family protein [Alphaproteobacteria bacterium]
MRIARAVADVSFRLSMELAGRWAHDRLLRAAEDPESAQRRILRQILKACRTTELGRRYRISTIDGVEAFRARVPICDSETLRGAVDRQIASGRAVASSSMPIMYARTSGTTGAPKLIPVTSTVLRRLKRAQRIMAYVQHASLDAFRGSILGIGGAVCEEWLRDGTPAGAATGLIYETMPAPLRAKYLVPPAVFAIADYDLKYATLARLAVGAGDLSAIATANPSTILRLVDVLRNTLPEIVGEIEAGVTPLLAGLSPETARSLSLLRSPDPRRAAALQTLLDRRCEVTIADLWPDLRSVVTWLGGGCAHAADRVRRQLPPGARMIDAGYVASELRGTVVVDADRNLALPLLQDVFFEFVPVEEWDKGARETLLLHQLQQGRDYHVIVSTEAGLLRYHMNDVLRAGASIGRTPSLSFIRKGRGVTNITGEKLTEDQVHLAMAEALRSSGVGARFYTLVALPALSRYRAYVEFDAPIGDAGRFQSVLDQAICRLNIEYSAKRRSGRLHPLRLAVLRAGAAEAHRRHCVEVKGQRESQLKIPALLTAEECRFNFDAHLSTDAPLAVGHS